MDQPPPAEEEKKKKEVKLWGGRFEENVTEAVERFTESISFDKQLYKQDIMGSRAHASMLAHQVALINSVRLFILIDIDLSRDVCNLFERQLFHHRLICLLFYVGSLLIL